MFKEGDQVRRKPERQVDNWTLGDSVLVVTEADESMLRFAESAMGWSPKFFDLVKPASPVPQYSKITQHKVGPYCVTVVSKVSKDSIMEMYGRPKFPHGPMTVLQECEEDYRDPEISHEDMLERLRDRLVSIEGVTQIDIVGVNDGCGVRISLEG